MLNVPSKCRQCDSNNVRVKLKLNNNTNSYLVPELSGIVRMWNLCDSCGICFSFPELNSIQVSRMYDNYRNEEFRGETPDQYFDRITSYSEKDSENFYKVKHLNSFIETPPDKVLDIGCGGGVLIDCMKKIWPNSIFYGVEPTKNFCELTSRRTGAITKNSFYGFETYPNESFDLITCCQVFEHVKDLKEFAQAVRSNMHLNSYFYLEVPDIKDFDTLEPDHSRFIEPSHLWYFSHKFLQNFFEKESFKVIASKQELTVRGRNNLTLILKI